jgi:hypothetical protein
MTQIARPSEGELTAFVEKLRQLRGTLAPPEQHLLDAVLLTAAGEDPAVEGYGLDATAAKRAALMAVVALGLAVGGMSSPGAGTAHASEMSQGGGRHSGGSQSTSQGNSQQGSGQQGSGQQGSGQQGFSQQGSGQQGSGHQGSSGSVNHQGNGQQGSGHQAGNQQGSNQHGGNQSGNQWSRTNQGGNHWNRVPSSYQNYFGPRYTYSQDWYYYRHISFPDLYQVVYEEPAEGAFAEYYFYEGAFYCFVG